MKSKVFAAALLWMGAKAQAAILGLYGSECLKVESLSAYKDLAFDGETLKQVQTVFGDSKCHNPAYDFVFEGPYALDETLGFIDYKFSSIRLKPLSEAVAASFNHYALCGITNWTIGENQEVAGLNCGGQLIPQLNQSVYDRIDDTDLGIRMGRASDELNGSTPNHRPTALDHVVYHAK
jgi:hypothetical protein